MEAFVVVALIGVALLIAELLLPTAASWRRSGSSA